MPAETRIRPITEIAGCFEVRTQIYDDDRGSFTELFRSEWFPGAFGSEFQLNLSYSRSGVIRGLHFHREQSDFWMLLEGSLRAVLLDLRKGSPSWCTSVSFHQKAVSDEGSGLFIPPGVAHGYASVSDGRLLYVVSSLYDGSDEFGVAWDDPSLELDWGVDEPVLSDRDRSNPKVADLDQNLLVQYDRKDWWPGP